VDDELEAIEVAGRDAVRAQDAQCVLGGVGMQRGRE
jgi:hypothetical protein